MVCQVGNTCELCYLTESTTARLNIKCYLLHSYENAFNLQACEDMNPALYCSLMV